MKQKYHKYTKAELAYFNKPIPVTKADWDSAIWAILFVVSCSGILYLVMR